MLRLAGDFGPSTTDTSDENFAAPPNATGPGEFSGENGKADWNYNNGWPRQDHHRYSDEDDGAADDPDEKFTQTLS